MKHALWAIAVLSTASLVACSENLDSDHSSPVLDRDQQIHKPGGEPSAPGHDNKDDDNKDDDKPGTGGVDKPGTGGDDKPGTGGSEGDSTITVNPTPDADKDKDKDDEKPGIGDGDKDDDKDPIDPIDPTPSLPDKDPTKADDAAIDYGTKTVDGVDYPIQSMTNAPYTTLQRRHKPTIGSAQYSAGDVVKLIANGDLKVTQKKDYKLYGLGTSYTQGKPWNVKSDLLRWGDPGLKRKGKSLAYFWQVSDPQIIDAQSPCRMEAVVRSPYVVSSAYRAQGIYSTHMFDMHVQTARRISDHSSRPFDFALVTGDIADNAQTNEFDWFDRMMSGGVVEPDSGKRDDPIAGPNNDFTDPYYARGLGNIPWYIAIGNHDNLYMGFTPIQDAHREACIGDTVVDLFDSFPVASAPFREGYNNGFQDASDPDSPVRGPGTKTVADARRMPLTKIEALQKFYNAGGIPQGHGLDLDTIAQGWGYYATYPIEGKPIKLITLDTNSGKFSEADMAPVQNAWLKNQLDIAKDKHELVILQSHHGTSGFNGEVTAQGFHQLVASYENVIVHITGHGHSNSSTIRTSKDHGYWEVMLASVVDFPSQSRIFEIVYEGDGIIDIYLTNIEPNAPRGSFVDTAVQYAAARRFFGGFKDITETDHAERAKKILDSVEAESEHMNLVLRTRVPKDVYENLEKYKWSNVIESETLLNKLKFEESK